MNFEKLITKHVQKLVPYLSARRIGGHGHNFLNANESPKSEGYFLNSSSLNRYPDCQPEDLVERFADYANVHKTQVIATRGSDEAIGLLVRTFCEQEKEGILIAPPTYGMYEVAAETNNVLVATCERNEDLSLNTQNIIDAVNNCSFTIKVVFIDSPANPLGTCYPKEELVKLLKALPDTLIVLDEAYIEFAPTDTDLTYLVNEYDNLVITRTLSKAFALAGLRCGFAIANEAIIKAMLKVIDPYPICDPVAQIAVQALSDHGVQMTKDRAKACNERREILRKALLELSFVKKIFPSDANFLLVEFNDGPKVFDAMAQKGVILRSFETKKNLKNCIRITIGSDSELEELMRYLKALEN